MKHAIITGAAGNLGHAAVNAFLEKSYSVHGIVSPGDKMNPTKRKNLSFHQADLMSDKETFNTVSKIMTEIETIDLVLMTVGGFAPGGLQEVTLTDIEKMYRLNFITAFNVVKTILPYMKNQKTGGQLVFIGAQPGIDPEKASGMVAYALSKSLIFRLSEIINEYGKNINIRSFVVVPDIIDTPQNRKTMPHANFTKWLKPEEIAIQILKLVSETGMKIPGNILQISGKP